jgi:heme o synthase
MLAKPGIIVGNLVTMMAGFALGSHGPLHLPTLLASILGLSCIIASACIFNNAIDRKIDAKMVRTQNRAIAAGAVSVQRAILLGSTIGLIGSFLLAAFVNRLSLSAALFGFVVYVAAYSILKTQTRHATLIGSIAGAIPPVVGYTASANALDLGTWVLFLIVVFWQMPHFFAIAIYRLDDYAAASIPVLPLSKGMKATKIQMTLYTLAFFLASLCPFFLGMTGSIYLVIATLVGFYWLCLTVQGFWIANNGLWAKKIFRFSLLAIMAISLAVFI